MALGIAFAVVPHEQLMDETLRRAQVLASKPITSLIESKALMLAPIKAEIDAARQREDGAFQRLLGAPANIEAMTAFAEKREPDFSNV